MISMTHMQEENYIGIYSELKQCKKVTKHILTHTLIKFLLGKIITDQCDLNILIHLNQHGLIFIVLE